MMRVGGAMGGTQCVLGPRRCGRGVAGVLVCFSLAWGIAANAGPESMPDLDRAELLSWVDPPAALQLLDKLQPTAQAGDARVQWLMARGFAYADADQEQAQTIAARLHELGRTQASAEAASHLVRAQLYLHNDKPDRSEVELKLIGADATLPAFELFRRETLQGAAQLLQSRFEAAASDFERARDLANATHNTARMIDAMIRLANLYSVTLELTRAASLVAELRTTAQQTGEEILLSEAASLEGDVKENSGDHAGARRALLEAVSHARRSGSERPLAMYLIDLGNVELKLANYAQALDDSTEVLALARQLQRPLVERLGNFLMGMAQLGLGHLQIGKQAVDSAVQQSLAMGDLYNADEMMGRYRVALERAGDLRAAVEVMHRDETVRDQLAASEREKALVDLTAKFDNERRARQIELLERDNAIKSRDLRAQRLRQQMIVMSAALVVLACAALFWGIARIRKINASLLHNVQHDSLTGLLNRRYFNEHILAEQADRPYVGCLLMAALDNTEHINDTWGYAANDAVLRAVSQRLSSALPGSDAWVHWAGEVFLVKTGPMSEAQLNLAARRLLSEIHREPVAWDGRDIGCTVSVGYASFPIKGAAADISLERAITLVDQALRQARLQGGDRACLITLVRATDEQELSFIDGQFDGATSDRRVQLVETVSMTA